MEKERQRQTSAIESQILTERAEAESEKQQIIDLMKLNTVKSDAEGEME